MTARVYRAGSQRRPGPQPTYQQPQRPQPPPVTGFMRPLSLIVAVDKEGGFGKDGKIPWHFPEDFKHFQRVTKGSACIMGRNTYLDMYNMYLDRKTNGNNKEDLVVVDEILPNRDSYVVTRMPHVQGATVVSNIRKAVETTQKKNVFVLGGENIFIEALSWVNRIFMTVIMDRYGCDKFFPVKYVHNHFKIVRGAVGSDSLRFVEYQRVK